MALDVLRQVPVARGLARLAFQQPVLFFQRADDIFQSVEVGFRRTQAQFGFVAARVQPGDPRSLFEQSPALGRFRIDDRPDPPLADHCRRPGAG